MAKVKQKVLKEYKPLFIDRGKFRYIILMGGRGAGRSTASSQFLVSNLLGEEFFRAAIMRFIKGDIRNSIFKEVEDRIDEQGIENIVEKNTSSMSFKYGKNEIQSIGFRKSSGDQSSKLKSLSNFNTVVIEEADEVPEDDFMQLDETLRTVKGQINIILVLNPPTAEHWIIKKFFTLQNHEDRGDYFYVKPKENVLYINTNYKNNVKNLSQETIDLYESYKETKPHRYYNQILGLIPTQVIGKIYNSWKVIGAVPENARLIRRGLDFGYSQDPTVIIDIYEYNGGYIIDEIFYRKGASNKVIADFLIAKDKNVLVIADSAEPKSIDEIIDYGVNIIGATKGQGSVLQGIQYIQGLNISITNSSAKTIKAYNNYTWDEKSARQQPDDSNHEWSNSLDALRYGFNGAIFGEEEKVNEIEMPDTIFEDASSNY